MLLFVKYGKSPWIHMIRTMYPDAWLENATSDAMTVDKIPKCLCRHPGDAEGMADFLRRFLPLKNPENGAYPETPEILDWLAKVPQARVGASSIGRPVTFGDDVALQIFREAWKGEDSDTAIARRYGVSSAHVGMIARGDSRKHLFKVRVDGPWVYVSENAEGAPEYRFRNGGRAGRKG